MWNFTIFSVITQAKNKKYKKYKKNKKYKKYKKYKKALALTDGWVDNIYVPNFKDRHRLMIHV